MRRACVPSPMRGRWRGAPDEVVDVDDRPLIRQFSRWSNCHLPRIAASPQGKAFGRPHPMKQCAAPVFLPLLRGRWRGAPDEVVDVDDHPLIRQFSRWSNCHPLRQAHRRSAEKAKPFGFFFRLAHRRGEGFCLPLPINILQRSNERNAFGMKKGGLWAADIGNQSSIEIRSAAPSASSHKPTGCS